MYDDFTKKVVKDWDSMYPQTNPVAIRYFKKVS